MNIVYGGVFNPPTIAHENAIKKVLKVLDVERFIVVPVGGNYHLKNVTDDKHRFSMVQLITDKLKVELSDIELNNEKYEGTYSLLRKLDLPDTKFLIGSDNLSSVEYWIEPESILSEFGLVVLSRNSDIHEIIESSELLSKYKHNIVVIDDFNYEISSTMFRESLDFSLVTKEIKKYIIDNDLYGGNHVS